MPPKTKKVVSDVCLDPLKKKSTKDIRKLVYAINRKKKGRLRKTLDKPISKARRDELCAVASPYLAQVGVRRIVLQSVGAVGVLTAIVGTMKFKNERERKKYLKRLVQVQEEGERRDDYVLQDFGCDILNKKTKYTPIKEFDLGAKRLVTYYDETGRIRSLPLPLEGCS